MPSVSNLSEQTLNYFRIHSFSKYIRSSIVFGIGTSRIHDKIFVLMRLAVSG